MEEPPTLGGAPRASQLSIELIEIVQGGKRRAVESSRDGPTIAERRSLNSKRQQAFAAIIAGARRLTGSDYDVPPIPSPSDVEQLAYRNASLLAGASEEDLDRIVALSTSDKDVPLHVYRNLIDIGVFDTIQGASRFVKTKDMWTVEYIRLFAAERGWVGVALLCSVLRHSPLMPDARAVKSQESLAEELASKYSQSIDEDEIPEALRDSAIQSLELAVSAHHLDSEFFSMKRAQVVSSGSQLTSMSFSDACPLFSKYDNGRLLASGAFGVVLKYARRDSLLKADNVPLFCAVKIQRTSAGVRNQLSEDVGLRELLVMSAIDAKIRGWANNPVTLITNSVTLYDWVKCTMILPRVLKSVLTEEDFASLQTRISDEPKTYQILVQEYVDGGDLESTLLANHLFWNTKSIAALYAQLFGFFSPFYAGMSFMHNDFKTPNVLLKRMPVDSTVKYLHYNHALHEDVWVPLADSHGFVFKLADFGLSMITVGKNVVGDVSWRAQPGLDLEVFTVWLLTGAALFYKDRYLIDVPAELIRFMRSIILPPSNRDKSGVDGEPLNAAKTRAKVIGLLSEGRIGKPTPDWRAESEVYLGMYTFAKLVWRHGSVYPDHRGTVMITRMFNSLNNLVRYDKPPADLAAHNVCDMTPVI